MENRVAGRGAILILYWGKDNHFTERAVGLVVASDFEGKILGWLAALQGAA